MSAEIKVPRSNIIIANQAKPLRQLGKGTLTHRAIIVEYENEIKISIELMIFAMCSSRMMTNIALDSKL